MIVPPPRPFRGNLRKIVILRPGALGDVLAVRGVVRFLRNVFPRLEIILAAPGEKGGLFRRPDWADAVQDWSRAAFSWLFSSEGGSPPPDLRIAFADCDWILAYVGADPGEVFRSRLAELAPVAGALFSPAHPEPAPGEAGEPIGIWLLRPVLACCRQFFPCPPAISLDPAVLAAARFRIAARPSLAPAVPYAVFHPGSGGAKKNWPLENYAALGKRLAGDGPICRRLVVTSGEEDGDLGERLAAAVPGAGHVHNPTLENLAGLLAHAGIYIGNDSGVSHLAAAVEDRTGKTPDTLVIFGPSDARIWAPPGAKILSAGREMRNLPPEIVWREILSFGGRVRVEGGRSRQSS
ncbi:MAG: glycosyltransferase family 9 protein [Planctomycetota bacterium]|jgi:heptosyltransferase-2|nr:glycosyltransferase family 9 protein [Planctomycetota bacterium]